MQTIDQLLAEDFRSNQQSKGQPLDEALNDPLYLKRKIDADILEELARLMYGDIWKSNIAEDLKVDPRRITHWIQCTRAIPDGVWTDLAVIATQKIHKAQTVLGRLAEISSR